MSSSSTSSVEEGMEFGPAGSAYTCPSVIIDVDNQSVLTTDTKLAFGNLYASAIGWVPTCRLRGNFAKGMVSWGFSCGIGKVANAVTFVDEKIVFYIASKGHGVGYLGSASDGAVFSKTKIKITVRDLMRGSEKSVEFDGFSKPANHADRYLLWEVEEDGEWASESKSSTGLCGMFLVTIEDISEFYSNPDWSTRIWPKDGQSFPRSASCLQVLAYEWRDALGRIAINPAKNAFFSSDAEFRTETISPDTLSDEVAIFDSMTRFPLFQLSTPLSDEQKKTIIRDSAMVLLSSQSPILPADSSRAPIIGIGVSTLAMPPSRYPDASARPAELLSMDNGVNRLFSLAGVPVLNNTLDNLNSISADHSVEGIIFKDPARILSFDSNGNAGGMYEGVTWSLSAGGSSGLALSSGGNYSTQVLMGDEGYEFRVDGDFASSSSSSSSSISSKTEESSKSSPSTLSSDSSVSSPSTGSSVSSPSTLSSESSASSPSTLSSDSSASSPSTDSSASSPSTLSSDSSASSPSTESSPSSQTPLGGDRALLENGDFLLLETGDKVLLDIDL